MGDMADYYADLALNSQFDTSKMAKEAYDNYERGLLTWKTKSGEGIKVTEMSNKHLQNSINMLIRKHEDMDEVTEATIDILKRELKSRA
jgi:rRNA maturation endonuclease Nob1